MTNWDKFLQEEVSTTHRQKVMSEAASLLEANKKSSPKFSLFENWILGSGSLGLATLAALFGVFLLRRQIRTPHEEEIEMLALGSDLAEDPELFMDLELLEDLEVIEKWEES